MTRVDIVHGLPNDSYHGDYPEFISSTSLKMYTKSQRYFKHKQDEEKVSKPHFEFGNVYHTMVSARHPKGIKFEDEYVVFEAPINDKTGQPYGVDTKAMQEAKALALTNAQGKLLCSSNDIEIAQVMCSQLFDDVNHPSHEFFNKRYLQGVPEVSYFATDFLPNIHIRTRPDLDGLVSSSGNTFIADYKTTDDLEGFLYSIESYGYDISAGMYCEVKKAAIKEQHGIDANVKFYWIVQEKKAPYDWIIIDAENYLQSGTQKFYDCLNSHKIAMETGLYGGMAAYNSNKHGIFKPKPNQWNTGLNKLLNNNETS